MSVSEVGPEADKQKAPLKLSDALINVQSIVSIGQSLCDPEPMITAPDQALLYSINLDTQMSDATTYTSTGANKFQQELQRQAKLLKLLEQAQYYAVVLYTWRSCSLGIPMIKSNAQENRNEIYRTTYDVLKPEIDKLHKFYDFQRRAVHAFCEEMKYVCQERSAFISDQYLHTLGQFINMFAVLDELKNIKASIKNDSSSFKRAAGILKMITDPKEMAMMEAFSMFLANNNSIMTEVKKSMNEVPGYEGLMCDIINTFVEKYDNHVYLKPTEKHVLVKVIGFCLYLIDSENMNINKLDGKRKLNLSKIDKIFKQVEVVPLFGDMMIGPFKYIESTPNFDPFRWGHCMSGDACVQSQLDHKQMNQLRQEHVQLVSALTSQCYLKETLQAVDKKYNKHSSTETGEKRQLEDVTHKVLYDLALDALHKLSAWTCKIMELFSWKLLHPADPLDNRNMPKDAESYERATKYNYTGEEKSYIVEVIAMIKSVQQMLIQLEDKFHDAIIRHIYCELQEFVQLQLREPLRRGAKQKKEIIKTTLLAIQETCADLANANDRAPDPLLTKLKKDTETGYKVETARKQTPPSSTQLYLLRTMLESLVEKKDKNTGRKTPRKDLDSAHVSMIENFLKKTLYWPYLLDFGKSVQECCDLSQMWYREFYLEMTKGEKRQFPIEMSIPWILTDHVLETKQEQMIEYVLYPLDLYNDSAQWALHYFKKQYLYDEIEAEVNLCFDQFVYKLSDQIFVHFKQVAASMMLNSNFRVQCKKLGHNIKPQNIYKYTTLMRKTHVPLLGRSIDLNHLIGQRINESILKSLNIAIGRFECGDLTGVMELQGLVSCNYLTHRLLSEYLCLDDFPALLQEADQRVASPLGRISQYLFVSLNTDFMPQFCYNASTFRFVRTVLPFVDPVEYDKPPNAAPQYLWGTKTMGNIFSTLYGQYSHFLGPQHFQAMVQMIGYLDIAKIFKEIQAVIKNIVEDTLVPYIRTLSGVLPRRCKMPRYEYTSPGILEYFQAQLSDIMTYSDLQPKVFQVFREFGNAVLFCLHLEQALIQKEIMEINHAGLFQHVIPKPYINKKGKSKEDLEKELRSHMKEMESKYKYQNVVPIITKLGTEPQTKTVSQMAVLTREKLCCGLSIFRKVLEELRVKLSDEVWQGTIPKEGVLDVVENMEFHRLWSAVQFIFCLPQRGNEYTIEMLFGEGLNWAGCTLIALLGQQRRFECMDFSYHLMKVQRTDQMDKVCKGVSVRKMVDRIRKFQILNDQVFSIINKYLSDGHSLPEPPIQHLDPPKYELSLESTISDLPPRARESIA